MVGLTRIAAALLVRFSTSTTEPRVTPYYTNFSVIDPTVWSLDLNCFSCSAPKDPGTVYECTNNTSSGLLPGSIAGGAGLTIVTTRMAHAGACKSSKFPQDAGGTSGHLSFKQPLSFGTLRIKSKYFPGPADVVKTAKGFIGLESPTSGAITITMHGKGGTASGEPAGCDWTRYMQSSVYQHGNNHNKGFSSLGDSINVAEEYNEYIIEWTSDAVTISVNGRVARKVTGAANVPQNPLFVRLHARSTDYNSMSGGSKFESSIQEFSWTPSNQSRRSLLLHA
jgi:hypothetical protein